MRRLFVLALSLTILLPVLAVLLALGAASSQAQCGGSVGPGSAPGVPSNLLAIYEQAAGSYQLDPRDGLTWPRSTRSRPTSDTTSRYQPLARSAGCSSRPPPGRNTRSRPTPPNQAGYRTPTTPGTRSSPPPATCTPAALRATGRRPSTPTTTPAGTSPKWGNSPNTTHRPPTARSRRSEGCWSLGASSPAPAHQDHQRGSCPTGSRPYRRTRRRRCRPRSRPATGSSTPPTAPNASRTCSAPLGSYDCSGSTDFVLYNADLNSPQVDVGNRIAGDSTLLETYGDPGPGHWITVYASANHAFIQIAGIVLDTAHWTPTTPPGSGPRWQPASTLPSQLADGNTWTQRHPPGL